MQTISRNCNYTPKEKRRDYDNRINCHPKNLETKLKEERYIHTLGVMYTAASMAMRHGADIQKSMTAGLLHDCGKYCDVNEQIRLCRKHDIELSDAD